MKSIAVKISVSDPWDVGEAVRWRQIRCKLIQTESGQSIKALIIFDEPIRYHGSIYSYAVILPRRSENQIAELFGGEMVSCVLYGITNEQAESDNPLDISKWRGGFAFEGDVVPVVKPEVEEK